MLVNISRFPLQEPGLIPIIKTVLLWDTKQEERSTLVMPLKPMVVLSMFIHVYVWWFYLTHRCLQRREHQRRRALRCRAPRLSWCVLQGHSADITYLPPSSGAGACGGMYTANTMSSSLEGWWMHVSPMRWKIKWWILAVLGMSLPYSSR